MDSSLRNRYILLVSVIYGVSALTWIFLSDRLLAVFTDIESILWLSLAKGVFFVLATCALLFFAMRGVPERKFRNNDTIIGALSTGILPGIESLWLRYIFAIAVTAAMLVVRLSMSGVYGDHAMLILFMFPIIISALLGGLGSGLVATGFAALSVDYFVIAPTYSFRIEANHDVFQWILLIVNGVAISLLSELLRQAVLQGQAHRQLLEAIVSGTSDAIFVKDLNGRYLLANRATADVIGRASDNIIGFDDRSLFPNTVANAIMEADCQVLQDGILLNHEEFIINQRGEKRTFSVTKGPIWDSLGKIVGLFGISRDITESKRTYDDLRLVLNEASDAIWIADEEGRYLFANPMACALTGHSLEELKKMHIPDLLPEDQLEKLRQHILDMRTQKFSRQTWELKRKDGGIVVVELSVDKLADGRQVAFGRDLTDVIKAEEALRLREQQLERVIDGSDQGYWDWNLANHSLQVSARWEGMLGYAPGEMKIAELGWESYVHPDDLEIAKAAIRRHIRGETSGYEVEIRYKTKTGNWLWVQSRGKVVARDKKGHPLMMSGTHTDVTERKNAEIAQRLAANVFDNSYEGIMVVSPDNIVVRVNPAFTRITGYSEAEILGKSPKLLSSGRQDQSFYRSMWQSVMQDDYWRGEIWNRRKDGEIYAELLSISVLRDKQGEIQNYIGVFSDISQYKAHEAELDRIAHYDTLTGTPNRRLLSDRIEQALNRSHRTEKSMAICFLDLDGFKEVNDLYGHSVGDQLLIWVSRNIHAVLRDMDTLARLGGDEFVILLPEIATTQECSLVLERVLEAVSMPLILNEIRVNVTASIGVSLYPQDDSDGDTLLRHADQAMYLAKQNGKNRYQLFDPDSDRKAQDHRRYLELLRQAFERGEFTLYYQPKVDLGSGEIVGAEALIRWDRGEFGMVSPSEFLPQLHGSNLELQLGEWVINAALAQATIWHGLGLQVPVSANVCGEYLLQPHFFTQLKSALEKNPHVPPAHFELEILETASITDMEQAIVVVDRCHALGVHFSLDDFGTGYSSLTYLRRLPVDTLKIDQSFVRDMLIDTNDLGIVEGVIRLATAFNRTVVAEGVETLEHGAALMRLGCHLVQGYGIAAPMPADQFYDWSNNWKREAAWLTLHENRESALQE